MLQIYPDWLRGLAIDLLPDPLLQQIRAYRRTPQYRAAGIVMIHVPRTAGTSLGRALYHAFLGHFTIQDLQRVAPQDVLALPRFTVVRNPWSRAVSAWSFAKAGGGEANEGVRPVFIARPEQYQIPAFECFERFVHEWLASQDLARLDGIFRQQCDYVLDKDGALPFDHVGRLEHLDETLAWLSQRLGRDLDALHHNRSRDGLDYRKFYTPALRDAIAQIYARDIEVLGYDF